MKFDAIVIGAGLSGLSCAIKLAENNKKVAIISKSTMNESNSVYAQGGIASVKDDDDNLRYHINDTIDAGAGLCNESNVEQIINGSNNAIQWLLSQNVEFSKDSESPTGYHLNKEGGHSHRRIFHYKDKTGFEIITKLIIKLKEYPNITVLEKHFVIDLKINNGICTGIHLLCSEENKIKTLIGDNVVLATGGIGQVYLHTTNPNVATGDGISMAYRAGANITNMEFIQFHPTSLYNPNKPAFLISEALRGEGGILYTPNNSKYRFMQDYDHRLELAPRDIVSRAIDKEMKKNNLNFVYLDITHKSRSFIENHFPKIYSQCLSIGIDISTDPIPVVPAAHYSCGGICTNINGETNISNLYAIGECAYTGLNGANRLASNSLLECIVMSDMVIKSISNKELPKNQKNTIHKYQSYNINNEDSQLDTVKIQLKQLMWENVGIVRTNEGLNISLEKIKKIKTQLLSYKLSTNIKVLELNNLLLVAEIVIKSALLRKESRGLHYSLDYPSLDNSLYNTTLNIKDS